MSAPVLITGMHRSGTSMLAGLLAEMGLFLGARLDPNEEDYFFLRLNEWMMRRAGGAWDWPLPTRHFLGQERFLEDTVTFLRRRLQSLRFGSYIGYSRLLLGRRRRRLERPWGWKDPRTVFTFQAWSRLFPEARLLYIQRNGVDVARSLVLRERKRWHGIDGFKNQLHIRPLPGLPRDAPGPLESMVPYLVSTRCPPSRRASDAGRSTRRKERGCSTGTRAQPEEAARFCGLEPSSRALTEAASKVRPGPPRPSSVDAEVRTFRDRVRSTS